MTEEHIELSNRTLVRIVRVPDLDAVELAYIRSMQTADARRIVSTYRYATQMAADLRSALVQAGVIADNTAVDTLLNDEGNAVLRVELTPGGMARFEQILAHMAAHGAAILASKLHDRGGRSLASTRTIVAGRRGRRCYSGE